MTILQQCNLFILLITLMSSVHHGWMGDHVDGDVGAAEPLPIVEMAGPESFLSLGGNNLRIRYSFLLSLDSNNNESKVVEALSSLSPVSCQLYSPEKGGELKPIASKVINATLFQGWQEVEFECGLIVREGLYTIRVVSEKSSMESIWILGSLTVRVVYPLIDFEVPHRLETYTTSVSITLRLTQSVCRPLSPLPPTLLLLTRCPVTTLDDNLLSDNCTREVLTILTDPLSRLVWEGGEISAEIPCHAWGSNSSYRIQIRETNLSSSTVIAKSRPIKVDWSSRFELNLTDWILGSGSSCSGGSRIFRALVKYPSCVLHQRDKVRVYGMETVSSSLLLPASRPHYIGEKGIQVGREVVTFSCNLFTPRFSRYCFQYVSTAIDGSVSIVLEKCIPTFYPQIFTGGGWSEWSPWTSCVPALSTSCGADGIQFRYRLCDLKPSFGAGANFCKGNSIEERSCDLPDYYCNNNNNNGEDNQGGDEEEEQQEGIEETLDVSVLENMETTHSAGPIPLHASLNLNLSQTLGCSCGCILDEILPDTNYTLVIIMSSNDSLCHDVDEMNLFRLKWILNSGTESSVHNGIQLDVIDVDLHCMKLTFRDGNTSDSNLLDIFTAYSREQQRVEKESKQREDSVLLFQERDREEERRRSGNERREAVSSIIRVESTGRSLSIEASESDQKDCTFQFIYLVAYYRLTGKGMTTFNVQREKQHYAHEWLRYEFWTFLVIKLVLSAFLLALLCSTFGNCVYHKYKYRQLKCIENEMGNAEDEEEGGERFQSRSTSATLVSLDWKQIRILRLKHLLLRPKGLNKKLAKIKSCPTTPIKLPFTTFLQEEKCQGAVPRLISSLSDTNLAIKLIERRKVAIQNQSFIEKRIKSNEEKELDDKVSLANYNDKMGEIGGDVAHCKISSQARNDQIKETNFTKNQDATKFNLLLSNPGNYGERANNKGLNLNDKLWKEKENLKRRQSKEKQEKSQPNEPTFVKGKTEEEDFRGKERTEKHHHHMDKQPIHDPVTSPLTANLSSLSSVERLDLDADDGLEMDYYDYDVMNVGNIPGSYLGLQAAFVLWDSEVYPQNEEDAQGSGRQATTESASNANPNTCVQTLKFADDEDDFSCFSSNLLDNESNL